MELDPEVIISSLHQPIRLRKMHNTNYWPNLWADRKLEAARTGCAVGLMALAVWQLRFINAVKVQFRRYIHFYIVLHNANPKIAFSHIYFCCFEKKSRRNWQSRQWNPPKKVAWFLVPMYNAHHWISVSFRAKFCVLYTGNYGTYRICNTILIFDDGPRTKLPNLGISHGRSYEIWVYGPWTKISNLGVWPLD